MSRARGTALVCALVLAAGCGKGGKVKVNGVVTLDEKPIDGAMVTAVPADGKGSGTATGTADKDGNFTLEALPGKYKVTVVYAEGAEPPPAGGMKDAFVGYEKAQKQKQKPPKYNVPAKYTDIATTDLTLDVPHSGKATFALKSGK